MSDRDMIPSLPSGLFGLGNAAESSQNALQQGIGAFIAAAKEAGIRNVKQNWLDPSKISFGNQSDHAQVVSNRVLFNQLVELTKLGAKPIIGNGPPEGYRPIIKIVNRGWNQ